MKRLWGVTGQSLPPKNDIEHARGLRNSAYAVNLTYDRHTYRNITRKMVPITRVGIIPYIFHPA